MKKQLLILRETEESYIEKVKETAVHYEIVTDLKKADMDKVEIVYGWDKDLESCIKNRGHSIKWLQVSSAGVDYLPLEELEEAGVLLTSANGIHSSGITESIFGMILSRYRGILHSAKAQREGRWDNEVSLDEVKEKTILIAGAGHIGKETARLAKAFGMKTIGVNRSGKKVENIDVLVTQEDIAEVLPDADIVVNLLPATKETVHFFGAPLFNQMKDGVLFLNAGRGATVSEKALIQALDSKKVSFAALDVFEEEPLPGSHEFWQREDILITPHISGKLEDYGREVFKIFEKNLKAYVNGKDLPVNLIDYTKGY